MQQYYPVIIEPRYKSRIYFTSREKLDLIVSILAITMIFYIASFKRRFQALNLELILFLFGISFGAALTGFLAHEMAHKYFAFRYGATGEYRANYFFLLIGFFFGIMGVIFLAPGAVWITGYITKEENGKISLAGPGTNILISLLLLPAVILISLPVVKLALSMIIAINIFLAFFNLLPIPPLDGSKVLSWNLLLYILSIVGVIGLGAVYYWLGEYGKLYPQFIL